MRSARASSEAASACRPRTPRSRRQRASASGAWPPPRSLTSWTTRTSWRAHATSTMRQRAAGQSGGGWHRARRARPQSRRRMPARRERSPSQRGKPRPQPTHTGRPRGCAPSRTEPQARRRLRQTQPPAPPRRCPPRPSGPRSPARTRRLPRRRQRPREPRASQGPSPAPEYPSQEWWPESSPSCWAPC